jgi:enoyl-CoA hydratase/carnithine racemase
VLTGAGGNFSSGVDLGSFGGDPPPPRADGKPSGFFACVDAVFEFDKPLLAAVQGVAVGGGCTIAVASDIVYVGESLRMRLPFANLGLVPEFASSYTLQSAIGRQRANELMFTAEWIDARRAVELGLAARALPDAELLEGTLAKAREIAQWPISALRAIKQTLQTAHRAGIAAARAVEDEAMRKLAGSPENIEAITAFMQKRAPDFKQFRKKG